MGDYGEIVGVMVNFGEYYRKLCGNIGNHLEFIRIVMGNYREIVGKLLNSMAQL